MPSKQAYILQVISETETFNYNREVETTGSDVGTGMLLINKGAKSFQAVPTLKPGFFADKDVRDIQLLQSGQLEFVFVANNSNYQQFFLIK
jgi:hypothetical protein